MNEQLIATAQKCLDAAHDGAMDFPTVVRTLMTAGFEGFDVDYRRGTATHFHVNGESVQLPMRISAGPVAAEFDAIEIEKAVRDAQNKVPGYTYVDFCAKVKAAGCAGYMVSFAGRRVLYFGRTAEVHVEHFPQ